MAARSDQVRRLIVLGSTGSIGTQTLHVVEHLNSLHARGESGTRFEIVGLAAGKNETLLKQQAANFRVGATVLGAAAAERLIHDTDCDLVISAMSGAAGLPATLAAIELGRDVALANKETLVAAGELVVAAAIKAGVRLLPIDSEHSGLWQCLPDLDPPMNIAGRVRRVMITASGGPFRTWTQDAINAATPEQALKHPTWSMGRKVTIDSATLMNKSLEAVEAHWLFGLSADQIGILIHPQSIIHALVEFPDGSILAQLGAPDMKTPIQHALTHARRAPGSAKCLNWSELSRLDFEPPDPSRFPAVALGHRAIREGGTAGATMNAANEAAVEAFLAGRIPFPRIADLTQRAMDALPARPAATLADINHADRLAREFVASRIGA